MIYLTIFDRVATHLRQVNSHDLLDLMVWYEGLLLLRDVENFLVVKFDIALTELNPRIALVQQIYLYFYWFVSLKVVIHPVASELVEFIIPTCHNNPLQSP